MKALGNASMEYSRWMDASVRGTTIECKLQGIDVGVATQISSGTVMVAFQDMMQDLQHHEAVSSEAQQALNVQHRDHVLMK